MDEVCPGRLLYPDCQSLVRMKERRPAFNPDLNAKETSADQSAGLGIVSQWCVFVILVKRNAKRGFLLHGLFIFKMICFTIIYLAFLVSQQKWVLDAF